jgi:O-antigen ligase
MPGNVSLARAEGPLDPERDNHHRTVPGAMYRVNAASSARWARPRGRRRWTAALVPGGLLLASVAVGRAVVETQAIEAQPLEIAITALGAMLAAAVMLAGPVACLAAIAALTVLRLLPTFPVGSGVDLFAGDLFFAALVAWWLIRIRRPGAQHASTDGQSSFRWGWVLIFLGYAGLTLLYVGSIDPDRLPVSSVSWLRLVQTASLGWFAATFLRTRRDVTVVLSAIVAAGAIAIVLAVAGGAAEADAGPLGLRGGGVVNPNELGLVSGLMLLIAAFGALGASFLHRLPLAALAAVGLIQSQSVASLVGTSVALLVGLAFMVAPPRRILATGTLRSMAALGVALAVAYGLAAVIRPTNLPTSENLRDSSTGARAVLAVAGLEIAERNPVIGVGWRRSETPEVIGDPDLNRELRARFPATRNDYFPDVSPASVHNAYVQILADLGVIGLGLLLVMVVSLARSIMAALERVRRGTPEWAQLGCLAWGLVLILVWWNDNPLYGGQTESVTPALFVGAIAGLARGLRAGAPTRRPPRQRRPPAGSPRG